MNILTKLSLLLQDARPCSGYNLSHVAQLDWPGPVDCDNMSASPTSTVASDQTEQPKPNPPTTHDALPEDAERQAQPEEKEVKAGPANPPGPPGQGELYKPKTLKFWAIMLSNFLAMFLVALDRTIVATAIPRITDEFHSQSDIGWYGSAYMLATSASQLLFGRIYRHYNMKW